MKDFPLEQWFDLTKKISKDDVTDCLSQMMLYAYKDGSKLKGKEWQETKRELRQAVKIHNCSLYLKNHNS